MKRYWGAFRRLLFPEICLACQDALTDGEQVICTVCRYELPRTRSAETGDPLVAGKFAGRVPVGSAHAFLRFRKGGRVQKLLHQLKYNGRQEVGEILGRLFGAELRKAGLSEQIDLIIPVPLHESRLRQRGYNQSECIARGLSEVLQSPWSGDLLRKHHATDTQTRKSRLERFRDTDALFHVTAGEQVAGRRIALIDDVVTTGSTLEACAQALLASGCREVHVWALATAM